MQNKKASIGLDIGTSKVRCVVGLPDDETGSPTVIGAGASDNHGMRKGAVIHMEEVAGAIASAVEEAERISGHQVGSATVSVNGAHIVGLNSKGVVAISSGNREITHDDIARVEEAATVVQLPANREILQVFAKNYRLDGQDNIKDPLGMRGVRLEVDAHIVTASTPVVKNLDRATEQAGLHVNHRIVSGLAAAEAVLDRQQKESGTVVVDIGAGTTDVVVFEEGDVQHVAVLPVGGTNLTNDLAIGLKTDLDVAEKVKLKHAQAATGSTRRKGVKVEHKEEIYRFDQEDIVAIVEARLDELFELVDQELRKINRSRKLPGGVVLVGGSANLPGLDEFVKDKLELPARVSKPSNYSGIIDTTDDPQYASAVGLMMLDLHLSNRMSGGGETGFSFSSLSGGIGRLLKRFRP